MLAFVLERTGASQVHWIGALSFKERRGGRSRPRLRAGGGQLSRNKDNNDAQHHSHNTTTPQHINT